jgi:shikimate kinase
MLAMNPRATLRHLLDQRRPLYEEVATVVVHTDGRTPDEVTDRVVAALRAAPIQE